VHAVWDVTKARRGNKVFTCHAGAVAALMTLDDGWRIVITDLIGGYDDNTGNDGGE